MTTVTEWSEKSTGNPILEPAARAFARARLVSINLEPAEKICGTLAALSGLSELAGNTGITKSDKSESADKSKSAENSTIAVHWLNKMPRCVRNYFADSLDRHGKIRFLTVFHSIGFCYWSDAERYSRCEIEDRGGGNSQSTIYNGTAALLIALSSRPQLLEAETLCKLDAPKLADLLGPGLLLMEERAAFLKELGRLLQKNPFLIEEILTDTDPLSIAFKMAELPGFADQANYEGETIFFLKRAQLLTADLLTLTVTGSGDKSRLTASADYKLPQLLREEGILEYEPALADLIDRSIELTCGGAEEVEIRLATILAVEALKELVNEKLGQSGKLTAQDVDGLLWILAQSPRNMRPYHRCRTVSY